MIDFELLFQYEHKIRSLLHSQNLSRNGGVPTISVKVPWLVYERVHDINVEDRVMGSGIAAVGKHSFTVVKHMLEVFFFLFLFFVLFCFVLFSAFVTTENTLTITSLSQALKVVFVKRVSRNALGMDFMIPFKEIINKGLPKMVGFFQIINAEHLFEQPGF